MRLPAILRAALLALLTCQVSACAGNGHYVELGGQKFQVELALTQEEQAMGLMFRESMPDDHGMLFVFGGEARRSFWMKNTRIPLDILYFDSDLVLVSLAWMYVALRYVHSFIHTTYNTVMHRFYVFAASAMVLLVIWLRLGALILLN